MDQIDDKLSWMTRDEYCRRSGMSEGQIRGRVQRGVWVKGVHYAVRGRRTLINWREVEHWIATGELRSTAAGSKSDSSTKGSRTSATLTNRGEPSVTVPKLRVCERPT